MSENNSVDREEIVKIINSVKPALSAQAYIPALTHIKFNGETAQTYNDIYSISVKCKIELDVCLPGDLLLKALSSMKAESVFITLNKDLSVTIASGRSKLKIPSLPHDDFPFAFPKSKPLGTVNITSNIIDGINRCMISVGNDPTHPAQMGVTMEENEGGELILYSTDNFTISQFTTDSKQSMPGDIPVILPTFFCNQLLTLAKIFKDEEIKLIVRTDSLIAEFGKSATLFSKLLVDLEPMDFNKIIQKNLRSVSIKEESLDIPDSMDSACSRALLVLQSEMDKITKITVSNGRLKMFSESSLGQAEDTMTFKSSDQEFHTDPYLINRALGQCNKLALLEKVMVLSNENLSFIHLIAHCAS